MTHAPHTPKAYRFKKPSETAIEATTAIAGVAAFGAGLCAIFNPVAVAVAGSYAAYATGAALLLKVPAYKAHVFGKMQRSGALERVADDHEISVMAKELSEDFGLARAPAVYTLSSAVATRMAMPFGLRWLARLQPVREFIEKEACPKIFAASPDGGFIFTTKQALARRAGNDLSKEELRFILAHETGHLKTDRLSPVIYGRALVRQAWKPLTVGLAAAAGLSLFGVGLPVTAGMGIFKAACALVGLRLGTTAILHFGGRYMERRADRNAIYATRDLQGAEDAITWLTPEKSRTTASLPHEALLEHPSYGRRIPAMRQAFNEVSAYPPVTRYPATETPRQEREDADRRAALDDMQRLAWSAMLESRKNR